MIEVFHDNRWRSSFAWALFFHLLFLLLSFFFRMAWISEAPELKRSFRVGAMHKLPPLVKAKGSFAKRPPEAVPLKDVPPSSIKIEDASKNLPWRSQTVGQGQDFEKLLKKTEEKVMHEEDAVVQRKVVAAGREEKLRSRLAQSDRLSFEKTVRSIHYTAPASLVMDVEEGMPGFTPGAASAGAGGEFLASLDGVVKEGGGLVKYESLDQFMDIAVYTYEDPKTREKYFMIKIFAKPGLMAFDAIPKEILFTIDASSSISTERLEEVKQGIRYCLDRLNKDDMFNVVTFKDSVQFFKPRSVAATPGTTEAAEKFVMALKSTQQTDVYLAFNRIVALPLSRVPSNVVLISDGRPTHGLVDSREVINSITRINNGVRPIFAFSGGSKVNRYLLDFTAYQNRGWSQYEKRMANIDKGLAQFYDKIKDPLLLNLRYRLNALNENEIFPKSLPDFYRNAEFTLYGRYTNEDNFSMQLLGDLKAETKELIFSRSLAAAEKGDQEIMRGWAFNKIYYLISELTKRGENPVLLKEVRELSRRYGVKTPYSPELEKID